MCAKRTLSRLENILLELQQEVKQTAPESGPDLLFGLGATAPALDTEETQETLPLYESKPIPLTSSFPGLESQTIVVQANGDIRFLPSLEETSSIPEVFLTELG
ncbi:MAG: hypothetical protein RML93_02535, partial [Anaerolineales bacterium]|nr:hypothetical protein [Anaerolineales bacterium]MDW8446151.1 hypothetical protein [Anaerolineales bacterium]